MNKTNNDVLKILLELEKSIANNYFLFLNETSNDYLYENIFSMMEDTCDMVREIYNILYKNKQLKITKCDDLKLAKKILELENKLKEINKADI